MINFENKKYLITGASSGIGKEIAIHLSELGASLVLLARDEIKLQNTLKLLKGNGHTYLCCDLQNTDTIKSTIEQAISFDNKKLDGFVHCAGVPSVYPLKTVDYEKFNKTFNVHTYSYLEILKYFSKKNNSNDDASVVFLSSILTKNPKKAQSLYVSSKSASQNLSKVLSLELLKRRIRINNVLIGTVLTDMVENTEVYRALAKTKVTEDYTNTCKTLSTKEVSNMVLFLLSDSAKYIIGEEYFIDGGYF